MTTDLGVPQFPALPRCKSSSSVSDVVYTCMHAASNATALTASRTVPCRPSPAPFPCAAEDFFFRTVHLGTDCWAFIALSRMASAQTFAEGGNWHLAAARSTQVRSVSAQVVQRM
jgi:hypothetical protein